MQSSELFTSDQLDELIFDYIEGEMDPSLCVDFERMVKSDQKLNRRISELKLIRIQARNVPLPKTVPSSDEFQKRMDALNARIMEQVETRRPRSRFILFVSDRRFISTAAAAVLVFVSGLTLMKSLSHPHVGGFAARGDKTVQQMMVDASRGAPEVVNEEGLSGEDQIDMYMDIMAQRMAKLNARDSQVVLDQLKK